MEPVDQVLAAGMKILLKLSHGVAAVGEKDYLLVFGALLCGLNSDVREGYVTGVCLQTDKA
jgi:hypothetical protein